jgi:hypothetical protein
LSGSYTSGGGTLSVTSASGLPNGACNYYVIVKAEGANTEEVFLVTSRSSTTLTVTGAQAGTSASNHASGAVIIGSIMAAQAFKQVGFVLLKSQTASGSASLDFTDIITSDFDEYMIEMIQLVPATDGARVRIQVSTNNGSSYDTTSGHYAWQAFAMVTSAAGANGNASDDSMSVNNGQTSGAQNSSWNGTYRFYAPASAIQKIFLGQGHGFDTSGTRIISYTFGGSYTQTGAFDAFRINMSSGNITSGTVRVYGLAK